MKAPVELRIWVPALAIVAAIALATAQPMRTAWRCYQRYDQGQRADARVIGKADAPDLVLRIESGPRAGETCTAGSNASHHDAVELGAPLRVVLLEDQPGCTLEGTLENSRALLLALGSTIVVLVLLVVLAGLRVQRSFRAVRPTTTRFDGPPAGLSCPQCSAPMSEGFLVPMAGVHWRDGGQPVGLPTALGGLPGTVGWRGRPRLHAYRCEKCDVATFRYGASRTR